MFKIAILQKRAINAQIDKNIDGIKGIRNNKGRKHYGII